IHRYGANNDGNTAAYSTRGRLDAFSGELGASRYDGSCSAMPNRIWMYSDCHTPTAIGQRRSSTPYSAYDSAASPIRASPTLPPRASSRAGSPSPSSTLSPSRDNAPPSTAVGAGRSRSTIEPRIMVMSGTMAVMMPILVAVVVVAATYISPWYMAVPSAP